MTIQERNAAILTALAEKTKRSTQSREAALEALVGYGIMTPKGNLRKPYKHLLDGSTAA